METFSLLLLAHLIGDFPLQTPWVYRWKVRSVWGLLVHALLHVLVAMLLVQHAAAYWRVWLVLGVSHFIVDWYKLRLVFHPAWGGFLLDQGVHVLILLLLTGIQPGMYSVLPAFWLHLLLGYAWLPALFMFGWVYATDRQRGNVRLWRWMCQTFVRYSQVSGYVLVLALLSLLFLV